LHVVLIFKLRVSTRFFSSSKETISENETNNISRTQTR